MPITTTSPWTPAAASNYDLPPLTFALFDGNTPFPAKQKQKPKSSNATIGQQLHLSNENFNTIRQQLAKNHLKTSDFTEISRNFWNYRDTLLLFDQTLQGLKVDQAIRNCKFPRLGIEVEIEDVVFKFQQDVHVPGWSRKTDGSLREGIEFISEILFFDEVPATVTSLYLFLLTRLKTNPNFSWRTGIHVHLDLMDFTSQQMINLILLYSIFEFLIFNFINPKRRSNIFCTPISETSLSWGVRRMKHEHCTLCDFSDNWPKYSALNFSRLRDLGTAEFRHLHGTWDLQHLINWIGIIKRLHDAALHYSFDEISDMIKSLNSLSNYGQLKQEIFGQYLGSLLGEPRNFVSLLSHGVSFAKECITRPQDLVYDQTLSSEVKEWKKVLFKPKITVTSGEIPF